MVLKDTIKSSVPKGSTDDYKTLTAQAHLATVLLL